MNRAPPRSESSRFCNRLLRPSDTPSLMRCNGRSSIRSYFITDYEPPPDVEMWLQTNGPRAFCEQCLVAATDLPLAEVGLEMTILSRNTFFACETGRCYRCRSTKRMVARHVARAKHSK